MSIIVTRTVQIVCILTIAFSVFGIISGGSSGNDQVFARASTVLGVSVVIFLLTTILRVLADIGERLVSRDDRS